MYLLNMKVMKPEQQEETLSEHLLKEQMAPVIALMTLWAGVGSALLPRCYHGSLPGLHGLMSSITPHSALRVSRQLYAISNPRLCGRALTRPLCMGRCCTDVDRQLCAPWGSKSEQAKQAGGQR